MNSLLTNRLRDIRASRGLSQSELANLAGVTCQTIDSIERGQYVPSTLLALALARRLEVGVDELFAMEGDSAAPVETTRDERTLAIENAGHRLAYMVLIVGTLLAVAYRTYVSGQPSHDLLVLAVASGLINFGYRAARRTFTPRVQRASAIAATIGVMAALVVVFTR